MGCRSLGIIIFLSLSCPAARAQSTGTAPAPHQYSHDSKGLREQFQTLLDAYSERNLAKVEQAFQTFCLPDPEAWFKESFAKEQAPGLVADYAKVCAGYEKSQVQMLRRFWPVGTHLNARISDWKPKKPVNFPPLPNAPLSTAQIPIEQYTVEIWGFGPVSSWHKPPPSLSYLVNVVYEQGAFRFLGQGAYPFWSMPPHVSPTKH